MKLVKEHINEVFTGESGPIEDLGIGMMHQIKDFLYNTPDEVPKDSSINEMLIYCAKYNKTEYVKYLIENMNADLHAYGELTLAWAVIKNNIELVKYLIDKGADVNADINGMNGSLLNDAFYNGSKEMIEILKDAGAIELTPTQNLKRIRKVGYELWKLQNKK